MTGRRKSRRDDPAKAVREMFGAMGAPPGAQLALDNLNTPEPHVREKSDRVEQLNARVPGGHKKRVRLLATRDGITVSELVVRAIALYEERYGAAPEL
jgi:hypothetical protein